MNTIPVSKLVQINPGVLAAAGTANNLNGLIMSEDAATPLGTILSFPDAASVGAFYGLVSPEYEAAQIYFLGPLNKTKTPAMLLFSQYNAAAAAGYLRTARLNLTLAQLKALSGTLTINVSGTPETSSSISLTAATSFSDAATIIAAAFTAPTFDVTYDSQRDAFLFTVTATGVGSTIDYASGTLAAGIKATAATGAQLSQGADPATPSTAMSALSASSQNWAGFTTTWEPVTADKLAFAAWVNLQNKQYYYVGWDSDPNAINQDAETTFGWQVENLKYDGTCAFYGDLTHASFVLGWAASADFTRSNGRTTLAYRQQGGLLPTATSAAQADALAANGYNFYGIYGSGNQQFNFVQYGQVSGSYLWMDSFINQIWMRTNLTLAFIQLLMTAGQIPYNQQGYALLDSAAADPINAAVNFGAIVPGVTLSAAQVQEISDAVGFDISAALFSLGWYLQISDADSATRVSRGSPPMTLYYTDGQSIQSIVLAAIEIQ